ncbi:hypothetical protein [Ruegeria arenilitoris]|uniref:hypothetical protein n=1 Tax=Ruegeria arenilitoris TaxID=1173585 RepID=UPI00147FAF4E|nr:hypothetical protein [Ruegeria arenilitoris]
MSPTRPEAVLEFEVADRKLCKMSRELFGADAPQKTFLGGFAHITAAHKATADNHFGSVDQQVYLNKHRNGQETRQARMVN